MPYPADCSDYNFGCLSLKLVTLAFHVLEMDLFLRVSATMIALPKNHPRVMFCFDRLFICLIYYLLNIKVAYRVEAVHSQVIF